jgi:hypothetical protein
MPGVPTPSWTSRSTSRGWTDGCVRHPGSRQHMKPAYGLIAKPYRGNYRAFWPLLQPSDHSSRSAMPPGGMTHCASPPCVSPTSKPLVQSVSGAATVAPALRVCSDQPAASMHCLKIWLRTLALASNPTSSGRVYTPRDVTQRPLTPAPEQVVKDGGATPLPAEATVGADGACRYAADRHRSVAAAESASVAPAFTQTDCEHPVTSRNAGANSQNTRERLAYRVFIGRFPSGAVEQPIDVER